jgi:hypothetical protein
VDKIKIGGEWADLPRVGEYWISDVYHDVVIVTHVSRNICKCRILAYIGALTPEIGGATTIEHTLSIPHFLSRYEKMTKLQQYLMGIENEA